MCSGMPRISLTLAVVLQRGGDPRGAEPAGAQGEAEAPRRLDDGVEQAGPAAAVVAADDRRDDDGGHLGEVLGEVRGRCHHLLAGVAGAPQPLGGGGHERQRRLAVELAELVLDRLVADDDPAAAAEVAAGRCLLGEVDAVEQQLVVDRSLEVEPPAHRTGRRQHLVDLGEVEVHAGTLLEPGRHGLVPRRAGPRVAVLAGGELVGAPRRSCTRVARPRVIEPEAVGQRRCGRAAWCRRSRR